MTIDLHCTRREMLAKISAQSDAEGVTSFSAHGPVPGELFEMVAGAMRERFAALAPEVILHDLLRPLQKAIGNAHKRGNRQQPEKQIAIEVVATEQGVVIAVSDEGDGFDVQDACKSFREGGKYFESHGAGFAAFDAADSIVSYERGGQIFLLCFQLGASRSQTRDAITNMAADELFMSKVLIGALPTFTKRNSKLVSCQIFRRAATGVSHPELRYVLKYRKAESPKLNTLVLTGRLLLEAQTRAELAMVKTLREGPFSETKKDADSLCVAKPIRLTSVPRLLLQEIDVAADLRDFSLAILDKSQMVNAGKAIGRGLRRLHECDIVFPSEQSLVEFQRSFIKGAQSVLSALEEQRTQAPTIEVQRRIAELRKDVEVMDGWQLAPTHGELNCRCIVTDGQQFFLQDVAGCRMSHPLTDVSSLLADLMFVSPNNATLREAIVNEYFSRGQAGGNEQLELFIKTSIIAKLASLGTSPKDSWIESLIIIFDGVESH